jgi:hypothetical protein
LLQPTFSAEKIAGVEYNHSMNRRLSRLGVLPSLLVGVAFIALGVYLLNYLLNSVWPISTALTDAQYLEVQRAIAVDRLRADTLLQVSNGEAIALFLFALGIMAMGLIMPLAYYINRRVQLWLRMREAARGTVPMNAQLTTPSLFVTMRQGFWFGLWVAFCMWLQINRTFGIAVAVLVAIVLILFELLLIMRALSAQQVGSPQTQQARGRSS